MYIFHYHLLTAAYTLMRDIKKSTTECRRLPEGPFDRLENKDAVPFHKISSAISTVWLRGV